MIRGIVNKNFEAQVRLSIQPTHHEYGIYLVDAVIDTGFTGQLTLPKHIASLLKLPIDGATEVEMADGNTTYLEHARVMLRWDRQDQEARVLLTEGAVLIGMQLLRGHRLQIDVVRDGAVTITRRRRGKDV